MSQSSYSNWNINGGKLHVEVEGKEIVVLVCSGIINVLFDEEDNKEAAAGIRQIV